MRPGPGLVVMALAFLSGARRGGTTTIISTTTTSTPTTNNAIRDAADSSESAAALKPKQRPPDEPEPDEFYNDDPLITDLFAADQPYRSKNRDSVLSRINPWLSACDLAQPDSAPDLQVRRVPFFHLLLKLLTPGKSLNYNIML